MREDFYAEYFRVEDRHWWFVGRRQIILAVLAAHLTPPPDGRTRQILDLGCGTGTMLGHLRRFGDAEGVDADERAVGFCRARGEDRVQLLETPAFPFPDDSFDLLTALDVLEQIEDDRGTLREVTRVLRPGGTFLATIPAYPWMWGAQDEISHHFRRYSADELNRKIPKAGLDLQRLTHFNTILFAPIAAVRLARRLRPPAGEPRSDFEMTREGMANHFLAEVFSSEARWLRRRNLPFGVSILALARAPEG
jgi:SAM-dependent methyltransferase